MGSRRMIVEIQYDLFEETTEQDELREEINALRISHDKVRKAMFRRLNEVCKLFIGTVDRIEKLEKECALLLKENKTLKKESQGQKF